MEYDRISARKAPFLEHPYRTTATKIALHRCLSQVALRSRSAGGHHLEIVTRFTEDNALLSAVNANVPSVIAYEGPAERGDACAGSASIGRGHYLNTCGVLMAGRGS
jgi:hypothetical protein